LTSRTIQDWQDSVHLEDVVVLHPLVEPTNVLQRDMVFHPLQEKFSDKNVISFAKSKQEALKEEDMKDLDHW
jgi:hypothetical protein